MSRWTQIHRHFPLRSLLAGYLYGRWLRLRRRLGYLWARSRRWQTGVAQPTRMHLVE
jgi:hypothetical protein